MSRPRAAIHSRQLEHLYNAAVYFENDLDFGAATYNYRSEFFVTFDRSTQLSTRDALRSMDGSFFRNVTPDRPDLRGPEHSGRGDHPVRGRIRSAPRAVYDNGRALRRRPLPLLTPDDL
jgi:hypothetical protein